MVAAPIFRYTASLFSLILHTLRCVNIFIRQFVSRKCSLNPARTSRVRRERRVAHTWNSATLLPLKYLLLMCIAVAGLRTFCGLFISPLCIYENWFYSLLRLFLFQHLWTDWGVLDCRVGFIKYGTLVRTWFYLACNPFHFRRSTSRTKLFCIFGSMIFLNFT